MLQFVKTAIKKGLLKKVVFEHRLEGDEDGRQQYLIEEIVGQGKNEPGAEGAGGEPREALGCDGTHMGHCENFGPTSYCMCSYQALREGSLALTCPNITLDAVLKVDCRGQRRGAGGQTTILPVLLVRGWWPGPGWGRGGGKRAKLIWEVGYEVCDREEPG